MPFQYDSLQTTDQSGDVLILMSVAKLRKTKKTSCVAGNGRISLGIALMNLESNFHLQLPGQHEL